MVLKTIVAATSPWVRIPRPPLRPRKTSPDLGLCLPISCRVLVTNRSQMQPPATICRSSRDIRGMNLEALPQVNLGKTEGSRRERDPCMVDRSDGQRFIDPPVSSLLAAVDALRVHPQQHLHTVTCTVSHLCGRDPAVQPERDGTVTQVVGPARQRRGNLPRCQGQRPNSCQVWVVS